MRNVLFAIRKVVRSDDAQAGKHWLRSEVRDYWTQRKNLIAILRYLATVGIKTPHWGNDAEAARLLTGAVENDSI